MLDASTGSIVTRPIVSPLWLQAQLSQQSPQVIVVDCRFSLAEPELGKSQYDQGHIPGAYYLSLNRDLAGPVPAVLPATGGRHPLPDLAQFTAKLNQIGLTAKTLVVAYDASRFAFASRLWWLLRYLGHDRVAVLDGGWQAWQTAGYDISTETPSARTGNFVAQPRPEMLASRVAVQARSPQTPLIDSRSPQRYRGEEEPIDPIAGSIPGAVNRFWKGVTDDSGFAKSPEEQAARWDNLAQAKKSIVYCGSGVTACVNLLSMAIAGIHTAQLYVGSWSDWCAYLNEQQSE